jgi:hypothetical protein
MKIEYLVLYNMLKASGCLEVKEWELGDLKGTK